MNIIINNVYMLQYIYDLLQNPFYRGLCVVAYEAIIGSI